MLNRLNIRVRSEQGFTLIELLVVILIIGILAAIAIPSFLSQKAKATDTQAKEMARTAEQSAETYSTDHNGEYTGMTTKVLHEYEPVIVTEVSKASAYLNGEEATKVIEGGKGYEVIATSTSNDTFTIKRNGEGVVTRTCLPVKVGTGCSTGKW